MKKEVSEYVLERLDFNENKLRECLKEIREIRSGIFSVKIDTSNIPDIKRLLGSEKYRIITALCLTDNRKAAYKLLNMNERTFYRKLKNYKIQ